MTFSATSDALDRLAPAHEFVPRWDDVVGRAGPTATSRSRRRRFVLAVALVVAILVPLATLAASRGWWFLESGDAPTPLDGVTVVKTGVWNGKGWELAAYRSDRGLCFAMTPTGSAAKGAGAGMSCAAVVGIPRATPVESDPPLPITYLAADATYLLPSYIVGPVVDEADSVAIYLADGVTLTTPTFEAPSSLGAAIRFYATPLPANVELHPARGFRDFFVKKLVGLDRQGRVVACLTVPSVRGYPLSACR